MPKLEDTKGTKKNQNLDSSDGNPKEGKKKVSAVAKFFKDYKYNQVEELWQERNVKEKAIDDFEAGLITEEERDRRFLFSQERLKEEPDEGWFCYDQKAIRIDSFRKEKEIKQMLRDGYGTIS